MHFHFNCHLEYYQKEVNKTYGSSCGLHLLYYRDFSSSCYKSVFSAITPSPFTKVQLVPEWKYECTHDSSWRNIQAFSQAYFGLAENINQALEADGLKPVAPIEMYQHCRPQFFDFYDWIPVEVKKDPTDNNQYR